jgi:peptidoglycan hydrolase-like protein with peptidoglycan-binding domain
MIKSSLIASISTYLSNNHFSRLFLCITIPLLIDYSLNVAFAASIKVAQVTTQGNINRPTLKLGSQGDRVSELQGAMKLMGFYNGAVDGLYQENTANAVSRFQESVGLTPNGIVDSGTWQKLFPGLGNNSTAIAPSKPGNNLAVPTIAKKPTKLNTGIKKNISSRNSTTKRTPQVNSGVQPTLPSQQVPGMQYSSEGWAILHLKMHGPEVAKLQKLLQSRGFLKSGVDGNFGPTTDTAVKMAQTHYGLEVDGIAGGATWEALRSKP